MSGNVQQTTPARKSRRRESIDENAYPTSYDDTPRPKPHPLSGTTILLPAQTAKPVSPSPSSSRSHSTTASGTTASGNKRKRGGSPSKAMVDRQYASYPVKRSPVQNLEQVNANIRDVVQAVEQIGLKIGVLSSQYASADWKRKLGRGIATIDDNIFSGGEWRDRLGTPPRLETMERVVEQANRNSRLGAPEMAWNVSVHGKLFDKAHKRSAWKDRLRWETITTATISHPTLPERDEHEKQESKKVDFCICLELKDNIGRSLYQKGYQQLNQTDYGPVQYNPIAVSIETKTSLEGSAKAQVQLTTWCTAQVYRLRALLRATGRPEATIPPLPLVIVLGHDWSLYYLEDHGYEATLWHCGLFGSTESLLGAYQILAVLQVLMQWSAETYLPWFQQEIIDPILS